MVSDFLQAALGQFDFQPQMPKIEIEYKRAYAEVAAAAGLTKEQAVRIYGFESGGNGRYDVQAGLEYPRPNPQAISTALGYRAPRTIMFLLRDRQHARFGGQLADDLTPVRLRRMPPASC